VSERVEQPVGALAAYVRAIRTRPTLIALTVLATLVGGLGWLVARTPDYRATARLLVDPVPAEDEALLGLPLVRDAGDPTRTAQTAAGLVESPRVAEVTARRLRGDWTTDRVLDAVSVEPVGQSNILAVTATAGEPAAAAAVANGFVAAAMDLRNDQLRRALDAAIERLRRSLAGRPAAEARDRVTRLEALRAAGDPTITPAARAARPESPAGPPWWLVLALALLGGGALGAGAAFAAELRAPRRLGSEEELVSLLPAPVLTRLPADWHRFRGPVDPEMATTSDVAFRSTHVQLGLLDKPRRTVMVSSPAMGDGKTSFVASLALQLVGEGERVIAMDLNLHAPHLADLLGVPAEPGLAAALDRGGLTAALTPARGIPRLSVVPGLRDARLSTLHRVCERLPALVEEARREGSHVLIDTPPLGTVSDAVLMLDVVDDLLVVACVDHTPLKAVEATRDVLRRARQAPSGLVVVGADVQHARQHDVVPPSAAANSEPPAPERPSLAAALKHSERRVGRR
jgi:tyrosine-protein kinase